MKYTNSEVAELIDDNIHSERDRYIHSRDDGYSRDGYSREGGYSGHGDMVDELKELMADAPDERTRREMAKLISKMEQQ